VSTFIIPVKIKFGGEAIMGSKKGVPHRNRTKEEKLKIVKLHLEEHKSIRQIEREYSVNHSLVSVWTGKYLEGGADALESHKGNLYAALHTSKSLSEVERLRLLVAKQEVEITRLKKGYWVEGVGANRVYVTGNAKNMKSSKSSK
jgi:transposase-like protein